MMTLHSNKTPTNTSADMCMGVFVYCVYKMYMLLFRLPIWMQKKANHVKVEHDLPTSETCH